jgi:hypothetical protein
MNVATIQNEFKRKVCEEIFVEPEGIERFIIYTPFMFDDGDHFVIILKSCNGRWCFTDEGHTFMHISYDEVDISKGTRKSIIDQTLLNFHTMNDAGELRINVPGEAFGDALFSFIQALVKISDTTYWTRERVSSTFLEDFRTLMESKIPCTRRVFNYVENSKDPEKIYPVDCKVNGSVRPLFVFGINSDDKCRDATITLQKFEIWGYEFRSMAVFEDQTKINSKVLARLTDVVGKQFSSLGAKERIEKYLDEALMESIK